MTTITRKNIRRQWGKQVDLWMRADALGIPVPEEHQSRDGDRDCWRGLVLPLLNMALADHGVEIPDRVTGEQERVDERHIGEAGLELFGDMSIRVPKAQMRFGDVSVAVLKDRTHVAIMIDDRMVAHATELGGVCRMKKEAALRLPIKVLRYNGPGSDLFG